MSLSDDALGGAQAADPVVVPARPSSRRTMVRGGSWNALAQLSPVVVNIALTPYVIGEVGLRRFGLYMLLLTIADFLATFDGGIYRSAMRFFALYAGDGDRAATTRLICGLTAVIAAVGVVLFTVLFFSAEILLALFRVPDDLRAEGAFVLKTLAVMVAFGLLRGVFAAVLNAHQRFAYTSVVTVFHYGIYAVGVIISLTGDHGLRGIALTLVVQTVVSTILLAVPAAALGSLAHVGLPSPQERRTFLRFASRAQVVGLADLVNLQSQPLVIGGFLDVARVGLYSSGANFAGQLRRLPMNAINPAGAILASTFSERGADATREEFARLQTLWVQGVTGWIAVAAGSAWFGVTAWLGDGFRLAGVVAVVLLLGALARLWTGMVAVYCQSIGHPEIEARSGVLTLVLNLVLSLALVMPFGVVGVVSAASVSQLLGSAYLMHLVRTRLGADVPSFLKDVPVWASTATVATTVALELLVRGWLPQGPLGLLLAGLAAAPALLVYLLVLLGPGQAAAAGRTQLRRLRPVAAPGHT